MKAVINLDVPDYQIGQPVTIYYKDTMCKKGICETGQEPVKPKTDDAWPNPIKVCGSCGTCLFNIGNYKAKFCSECGKPVKWK